MEVAEIAKQAAVIRKKTTYMFIAELEIPYRLFHEAEENDCMIYGFGYYKKQIIGGKGDFLIVTIEKKVIL